MGMYDEVRPLNISHKNFEHNHNDCTFQTKDLERDMSEYCVFNGKLFQQVDGSDGYKRHVQALNVDYTGALNVDYTGALNIYTIFTENDIESWIEYDLVFDCGELIDVVQHDVRIIKDTAT
jgi:hypothetical protein